MRKLIIVLSLIFLGSALSVQSQSRLTEKEKKKLEKEALRRFRKMEPEQVKAMYEKLQKTEKKLQTSDSLAMVLASENSQLRTDFDNAQNQHKAYTDSMNTAFTAVQDSLNILSAIYDQTAIKLVEAEDRLLRPAKFKNKPKYRPGVSSRPGMRTAPLMMAKAGENTKAPTGIYFRVQIGAYKNFKVQGNLSGGPFGTETEGDVYKYVFGYYSTLEEAETVKSDFVKMGIKDAWVVGFDNGKRISKEEAAQRISGQ